MSCYQCKGIPEIYEKRRYQRKLVVTEILCKAIGNGRHRRGKLTGIQDNTSLSLTVYGGAEKMISPRGALKISSPVSGADAISIRYLMNRFPLSKDALFVYSK